MVHRACQRSHVFSVPPPKWHRVATIIIIAVILSHLDGSDSDMRQSLTLFSMGGTPLSHFPALHSGVWNICHCLRLHSQLGILLMLCIVKNGCHLGSDHTRARLPTRRPEVKSAAGSLGGGSWVSSWVTIDALFTHRRPLVHLPVRHC